MKSLALDTYRSDVNDADIDAANSQEIIEDNSIFMSAFAAHALQKARMCFRAHFLCKIGAKIAP